ncbi:Pectinesterase, catalytic [Sesbania bispinosa]|nr:Pectinesterase, catalytic [Sesbania bispinosa]
MGGKLLQTATDGESVVTKAEVLEACWRRNQSTIITGNHNVVDGFTTFNSATFACNLMMSTTNIKGEYWLAAVVGQGFVAVNITFRNTAGPSKHQAVALRSGADMSTFYSCSFEGYQDTLYTHSMRQFYRECDIYGTVDFIFGNAAVVLQNCNIYPPPSPQWTIQYHHSSRSNGSKSKHRHFQYRMLLLKQLMIWLQKLVQCKRTLGDHGNNIQGQL